MVVATLTVLVAINAELPAVRGATVSATILARDDITSGTFTYLARVESGPRAGATYHFGSNTRAPVRRRVRLRWQPLPQGLDFASVGVSTLLWVLTLGGAITAMFVCGVVWAAADLRRVKDALGEG